jgi:hypothetical protein
MAKPYRIYIACSADVAWYSRTCLKHRKRCAAAKNYIFQA